MLGRTGLLVARQRKAEIAVVTADFAEPADVANHDEDTLGIENLLVQPSLNLSSKLSEGIGDAQPANHLNLVREEILQPGDHRLGVLFGNCRLEYDKPGCPPERSVRIWVRAGSQTDNRHGQDAAGEVLSLAYDQQISATLPTEGRNCRILDGDGIAKPGLRGGRWCPVNRALLKQFGEQPVGGRFGRLIPVEDQPRQGRDVVPGVGQLSQPAEEPFPSFLPEPDDLERIVPLDHAVGIVVDRFTGPGQQPSGGIVFTENQAAV